MNLAVATGAGEPTLVFLLIELAPRIAFANGGFLVFAQQRCAQDIRGLCPADDNDAIVVGDDRGARFH